ncbi:hypothetical protein HY625_01730 [Candidatus Uhrbacteria bacterium]|nr:hypothetical protein [Candidatus Uhrbacteria bacterium]
MALDASFRPIMITNGPSQWDLILALFESDMVFGPGGRPIAFKTVPAMFCIGMDIVGIKRIRLKRTTDEIVHTGFLEFEAIFHDRFKDIRFVGIYTTQTRTGIIWQCGEKSVNREEALRQFGFIDLSKQ